MELTEIEERLKALERRVGLLENILLNPIFPEEKDKLELFLREYGDLLRELSTKFEGLKKELSRLGWPR
jgi:hypothetical protein